MKKKLRVLADKIVFLEKECQLGRNMNENMAKIEEITTSLSIEEMLEIDEYISTKLTK